MKEKIDSISSLFLETELRFGIENASTLFQHISLGLPKKQYYTVDGLYKHMKRELDGYYNWRCKARYAKAFKAEYGVLNL